MKYRLLLVFSLFIAFSNLYAQNTGTVVDQTKTTQVTTTTETTSLINLNTATPKELMKVKGINASRARAIVAYRKKHGDFKSVSELNNVKGFKNLKPAKLQEIQNAVIVN